MDAATGEARDTHGRAPVATRRAEPLNTFRERARGRSQRSGFNQFNRGNSCLDHAAVSGRKYDSPRFHFRPSIHACAPRQGRGWDRDSPQIPDKGPYPQPDASGRAPKASTKRRGITGRREEYCRLSTVRTGQLHCNPRARVIFSSSTALSAISHSPRRPVPAARCAASALRSCSEVIHALLDIRSPNGTRWCVPPLLETSFDLARQRRSRRAPSCTPAAGPSAFEHRRGTAAPQAQPAGLASRIGTMIKDPGLSVAHLVDDGDWQRCAPRSFRLTLWRSNPSSAPDQASIDPSSEQASNTLQAPTRCRHFSHAKSEVPVHQNNFSPRNNLVPDNQVNWV